MSLANFNPAIWSASVLVPLRKAHVFASVVNRDYEQEIVNMGDVVKINEIGSVTVSNYTADTTISIQAMDGAQQELLIDQAKYYAVQYEDLDRAQNNPKLVDAFGREAAYSLADTVDQAIAAMYSYAGTTVSGVAISAGSVLQNIADLQLAMDEANVASAGRFLIVPPWYHQRLVLAATAAISSTAVPKLRDDGAIINGYIGELFGFSILKSNNVHNDATTWDIMALSQQAITFASQVSMSEAFRSQLTFKDVVRALYVYGIKVVRPAALVKCAVTKG